GKPGVAQDATIRIGAETIERILEGLGELLLDQAQADHLLGEDKRTNLRAVLGHLRRRALDLQQTTLRARMLPLDTLFRHYPRAVHDIATQLHKTIRLETRGGDTELDRLVMDRLHEPLLHLLRNACDHGIESPEVRRHAGKPETGTIRVISYASQGHVHIQLADDGAGIDWQRLRDKAIHEGWMTADEAAQASETALADLLFRPGVSTAEQITDLSGRGVGLDAVRAFLDTIHGTISVESETGQGTTFHLELPMTMAIMTALLLQVGPWTVGLPVFTVERIEEVAEAHVATALGQASVPTAAQSPLPVYNLLDLLEPTVTHPGPGFLVRVRDGSTEAALAVDQVQGQQEVVVKPVASLATVTPWLSGVAMLGDGRLALMLDVRRLVPAHGVEEVPARDDGILRAGSNQMEILVFRLGTSQRYGINVYKTREVLSRSEVELVSGQHPWLSGFIRLRGQTVPIVALADALELSHQADPAFLIVTEFNQSVQAFEVAEVERMVRVGWNQVEPLPSVFGQSEEDGRRFTGIIDHPNLGIVQLIDFEQILAQVAPPTYPTNKAGAVPALSGQTIWLADDSAVARQQVEKALMPLGVAVRSFAEGQALWDALEAGEPVPHLFIIDVEMPRLDGYTLTRRLKADPRTKMLPVLLHTSLSGHWHAERAEQVEADAIVTKFDPLRLAATAQSLLLVLVPV
ncbi:MAG: chemotaxis protein CheW, partial [Clostridia bacterium]